uniref:Nitronate monooxygenase domain-containing protein n=1 Tax=Bionectria ochroleuca TaxID=29856 RepID=A0A8H7KCF6_BIOOC
MGTRFLVADEAGTSKEMRQVVLSTTDGGSSTVKSYLHDDVRENSIWPKLYDGRAVLGPSIIDERAGISLSENITKLKDAQASGDKSRNVFWSGTGVGLVNKLQPAGDIVRETRLQAIERIKELSVFVEDTLTR